MIERLSSDTLKDQRISPNQSGSDHPSSEELNFPGESRKRSLTLSEGKNAAPFSSIHHRPLTNSRSTDSINCPGPAVHMHQQQHQGQHLLHPSSSSSSSSSTHHTPQQGHRERRGNHHSSSSNSGGGRGMAAHLRPSSSSLGSDNHGIPGNSPSGSSQSTSSHHRSLSPPNTAWSSSHKGHSNSPPSPTSNPISISSHIKRLSGPRGNQLTSRWSGSSVRSTDSASSEDSLSADVPGQGRDMRSLSVGMQLPNMEQPHYLRRGQVPGTSLSNNNITMDKNNGKGYQQQGKPVNMGAGRGGSFLSNSLDSYNHPGSNPGNLAVGDQLSRKSGWQANAVHPLQTSVTRGHSMSTGANLAAQHYRAAHTLPVPLQQQQSHR